MKKAAPGIAPGNPIRDHVAGAAHPGEVMIYSDRSSFELLSIS